jgi:hypothetical protein
LVRIDEVGRTNCSGTCRARVVGWLGGGRGSRWCADLFAFYGGAAPVVEAWSAFFFGHGGFGVGVEGGEMGD